MHYFLSSVERSCEDGKIQTINPTSLNESQEMVGDGTQFLTCILHGATLRMKEGGDLTNYLNFGYVGGRRCEPAYESEYYDRGAHIIYVDTGDGRAKMVFKLTKIGEFPYMELVIGDDLSVIPGNADGFWFGEIEVIQPNGATLCVLRFSDPVMTLKNIIREETPSRSPAYDARKKSRESSRDYWTALNQTLAT